MLASDLARALLWAYVFRPARSVRGAVRDAKTVAAKLFFILVAPIVFVASLLRCEEGAACFGPLFLVSSRRAIRT